MNPSDQLFQAYIHNPYVQQSASADQLPVRCDHDILFFLSKSENCVVGHSLFNLDSFPSEVSEEHI